MQETYPHPDQVFHNGALPGTASNYMCLCVRWHVPPDVDLVVVRVRLPLLRITRLPGSPTCSKAALHAPATVPLLLGLHSLRSSPEEGPLKLGLALFGPPLRHQYQPSFPACAPRDHLGSQSSLQVEAERTTRPKEVLLWEQHLAHSVTRISQRFLWMEVLGA